MWGRGACGQREMWNGWRAMVSWMYMRQPKGQANGYNRSGMDCVARYSNGGKGKWGLVLGG